MTPEAKADEYKPDLPKLKKYFEDAISTTEVARRQAAIDQDYYDGPGQWTPAERAILKDRKQPDNYFNRIRPAVLGTLGVIKQGATDPRAYPRNPQDEDAADVASKVLRFIADRNRFDDLKLKAAKDYLVCGICAAIVEVDEDRQVTVGLIRFEEFFYDPRSRKEDFSDARYMGIAKWQYADDVIAKYGDADKAIERTLDGGSPIAVDITMEDRPTDQIGTVSWADKGKRRIMTVELYHAEGGKWYRCVFHAGGILESGVSAYLDDKKRPTNPIVAQSCFVDRENNRYGIVRDMRGPQDEINKRRSKLLHRLSTNLVQENQPGALMGTDAELVRKEAARPDGVLPSGVQIVNQSDKTAGEAQLLQEAKTEIERMGPNPAVLGRQGEASSGRANLIRQQAGMTEQAVVFGGVEDWELRIYGRKWDCARQYWTAPMFVRTTDDEGSPEFIGVNQPQTQMDPMTGQPVMDAATGQPAILGYENALAELDVDIILDSVPDTANVQQEQFQMLVELAKIYGPQEVPFDDVLETSTMPNKRQVIDKRKARAEQAAQSQQNNPAQELQMRGAVAEITKTEAEAALTIAKADNEVMRPQMEAMKALSQPHNGPPPGL